GGGLEPLASTGRPLGLLPGGGFEQRCLEVKAGDSLFLFTDGLVEAESVAGEPFGMERLEQLLVAHRLSGLPSLIRDVDAAVRVHRGPVDAADDATMVAVRMSQGA